MYATPVLVSEKVGPWTLGFSHCVEYSLEFRDDFILLTLRQRAKWNLAGLQERVA